MLFNEVRKSFGVSTRLKASPVFTVSCDAADTDLATLENFFDHNSCRIGCKLRAIHTPEGSDARAYVDSLAETLRTRAEYWKVGCVWVSIEAYVADTVLLKRSMLSGRRWCTLRA